MPLANLQPDVRRTIARNTLNKGPYVLFSFPDGQSPLILLDALTVKQAQRAQSELGRIVRQLEDQRHEEVRTQLVGQEPDQGLQVPRPPQSQSQGDEEGLHPERPGQAVLDGS